MLVQGTPIRSPRQRTPNNLMSDNSSKKLHDAGLSIWLDYIDRTMLRNGDLQRRIATMRSPG